jgi:two-component system, response regulator YesN
LKRKVTGDMLQQIADFGIFPTCSKFAAIAVKVYPQDSSDLPDNDVLKKVETNDAVLVPENTFAGISHAVAVYEHEKIIYIIAGNNEMTADSFKQAACFIMDDFYEKKGFKAAAGIGTIVESLNELHNSNRQANEVLDFGLFWGDRGIAAYTEIESLQQDNASSIGELMIRGNYFTKQLMHAVRAADDERTNDLLEEMFSLISVSKWAGRDVIVNFLYGLLNETSLLFYNPDSSEVDEGAAGTPLLTLSDFKSIREYVCSFFGKALERIKEKRSNKDEYIVKKVEQIIVERYKSDISIKTIAAEIYLSPNYIGSIFKKCTGKPFNDYLCQYRLEKAKELLNSPKNNVSRVARDVGIPNTSYFCNLFKNMFGIAPGEYQEMVIRKL